MSKNVIFFLHGIGRHQAGWSRIPGGPIHALEQVSQQYSCLKGLDINGLVDLVEIRYDDIFDQHLDQWASLAQTLEPVQGASQFAKKITDLLANCNDDKNLFASCGGDVLLYCGFELIAKRVRLRVNSIISKKITETLAQAKTQAGPNPEFGIVGHSLGTTIVHDSLEQLACNNWLPQGDLSSDDIVLTNEEKQHLARLQGENSNPFAPGVFTWDSVFMISNTSRMLCQTNKNPYESNVQPGKAVRYFINVGHEIDPVCNTKRFLIPASWTRARQVSVDHIHDLNIHGYTHYLNHPKVHRLIFRLLVPEFTNTCNDEAIQAEKDYPKYVGDFKTASIRDALKRKLNSMIDSYKNSAISRFREMIEEYKNKIGDLS